MNEKPKFQIGEVVKIKTVFRDGIVENRYVDIDNNEINYKIFMGDKGIICKEMFLEKKENGECK